MGRNAWHSVNLNVSYTIKGRRRHLLQKWIPFCLLWAVAHRNLKAYIWCIRKKKIQNTKNKTMRSAMFFSLLLSISSDGCVPFWFLVAFFGRASNTWLWHSNTLAAPTVMTSHCHWLVSLFIYICNKQTDEIDLFRLISCHWKPMSNLHSQ